MAILIDLTGSVAIVTGGARGIGASIATRFVEAGATVVIGDIDAETASATANQLGPSANAVLLDVTDPRSVEQVVVDVSSRFGPPTVLVNNAFVAAPGPFLEASAEDNHHTTDVILAGATHVCRSALPLMVAAGGGRIINIVSEAGRVGEAGMVAYSAAKAGLAGLTKALAKEFGRHGITVNGVSPGSIRTETTMAQLDRLGVDERRLARLYPLGRLGEPDDVAAAVIWLASPLASWVTGQVIGVNGGYVMA